MRKILLSVLSSAVLLGAVGLCQAQDASKTLLTVSFSGYDKLLSDVGMIGQLGGNADLGKGLDLILKMMLSQGKGEIPLDTKQPWGAVLSGDGGKMTYYAFLPVSDVKPFLEIIKAKTKGEYKLENGIYKITGGANPVFVLQKGKWAYIADSAEQLSNVAADPASMLGDLPKLYELAVRVSMKNLPKEYREQLLAQLRAGAEVGMQQMPSESAEEHAARQNMAKQTIQQLTTLINELDEVLLGWNIDANTKTTYLDVDLIAQTGTKLAEQLADVKGGKTNFAGLLLPEAAVTMNSVGSLSDSDVAQAKAGLATARKSLETELNKNLGLGESEMKLAVKLIGGIFEVIDKTIEGKKTDSGMSIVLDPSAVTVVAGAAIADGAKLDATIKDLIDELKKNEEVAKAVKFVDETIDGVHLHTLSMPNPSSEMEKLIGDKIEAVVGIADDKLVVAAGRDAAKTLKTAIGNLKSAAGKDIPAVEIRLSVKKIARFVAEVSDDQQVKAYSSMISSSLEMAGAKDHVTVTVGPVSRGIRMRLEVEEGILQVLGAMSRMISPAGGMMPATP